MADILVVTTFNSIWLFLNNCLVEGSAPHLTYTTRFKSTCLDHKLDEKIICLKCSPRFPADKKAKTTESSRCWNWKLPTPPPSQDNPCWVPFIVFTTLSSRQLPCGTLPLRKKVISEKLPPLQGILMSSLPCQFDLKKQFPVVSSHCWQFDKDQGRSSNPTQSGFRDFIDFLTFILTWSCPLHGV